MDGPNVFGKRPRRRKSAAALSAVSNRKPAMIGQTLLRITWSVFPRFKLLMFDFLRVPLPAEIPNLLSHDLRPALAREKPDSVVITVPRPETIQRRKPDKHSDWIIGFA